MRISDWSSDVCPSDLCKARIGRSYLLHPRMHVRAAIEMGLHTAARRTGLQHLVDQQLHGVSPIALRLRAKGDIPFPRFGQKQLDRKSGVSGKSVYVRVDLGGSCSIQQTNT